MVGTMPVPASAAMRAVSGSMRVPCSMQWTPRRMARFKARSGWMWAVQYTRWFSTSSTMASTSSSEN